MPAEALGRGKKTEKESNPLSPAGKIARARLKPETRDSPGQPFANPSPPAVCFPSSHGKSPLSLLGQARVPVLEAPGSTVTAPVPAGGVTAGAASRRKGECSPCGVRWPCKEVDVRPASRKPSALGLQGNGRWPGWEARREHSWMASGSASLPGPRHQLPGAVGIETNPRRVSVGSVENQQPPGLVLHLQTSSQ